MQAGLTPNEIQKRIREAKSWQDHARLLFEVLHSPAKEDIQHLSKIYRAELLRSPSPLIRWAYANATIEVIRYASLYDIDRLPKYGFRPQDFLSEPQVFEELRRVVQEAPKSVMGYLGLASAYGAGLIDEQIVGYAQVTGEREGTAVINGRETRIRIMTIENPERRRRIRYNQDKVRALDPNNPYLRYWEARCLYRYLGTGEITPESACYKTVKKLSREEIALEGLRLSKLAYENGFKFFSPIEALGIIIYFACQAQRQDEVKRWGEVLKPWIAQSRASPYVVWLRLAYGHSCPYLRELAR